MRADASWFERRAYAAQMKRVCAAGNMRCPEGRRLFHVRFNPLLRADQSEFVSVPGGCALAGTFGRDGFFAAPCAADEAGARALLEAIEARQRAWGAARVTGPMSAAWADLNGGASADTAAGASPFAEQLPAFMERALAAQGYRVSARSILYELPLDRFDWPRYERAAAYAMRRFGYRVVSARQLGDRAACLAMARLSRTDPAMAHTDEETASLLAGLGRRWSRRMTQVALRGDEPIGFLLALADCRTHTARAATMLVRGDCRGRAVTAALALPMLRAAASWRVECGVIDEGNLASRLTAERAGAKPLAAFQRYSKELT